LVINKRLSHQIEDMVGRGGVCSLGFLAFHILRKYAKKGRNRGSKIGVFSRRKFKKHALKHFLGNASAKAFPADVLRQDHGWIISDESFRVYKNEFDEIRC